MTGDTLAIRPGIGLGRIVLGCTEVSILRKFGYPTYIDRTVEDGIEKVRDYEYEDDDLTLTFHAEDNYRLGIITSYSPLVELGGSPLIGISRSELMAGHFGPYGPPTLDTEVDETGFDFAWVDLEISVWLEEDIVDSVSVFPFYDDDGDTILWPQGDSSPPKP